MTIPALTKPPAPDAEDEEEDLEDQDLDDDADDEDEGDSDDSDEDNGDEDEDGDGSPPPDPAAELAAAEAAAREKQIRDDERARIRAEDEAARAEAEETTNRQRLAERFTEASTKAKTALQAITVQGRTDDGQPVALRLTDAQVTAALAHFEAYRDEASVVESTRVMNAMAQVANEIITDKEAQDAFNKKVGGKDAKSWVRELLEHAAPTTAYAKKLATDHELAIKKAKAEGFKLGKNAPPGQVSQRESRSTGRAKTYEQMVDGFNAGTLTDAEDAEFRRLEAEREARR